MKRIFKICTTVLVAGSLLGLAGCANKPVNNRVSTLANWNPKTSATVESNFYTEWQTKKEVIEYDVSFDKGANTNYDVIYDTDNAEYKTEFYMEAEYDWKSELIPENYRSTAEGKDVEPVYVYKSTRRVAVTYDLKDGSTPQTFEDVLQTVCKFRTAGNNLQPVYSEQIDKNTSPNTPSATSYNGLFIRTDRVCTTYYNKGCTAATVYEIDNTVNESQKEPVEIAINNKENYSVFDNSEILAAMRGFAMLSSSGGGSSSTFHIVAPQNKNSALCRASVAAPAELNPENAEQKQIIDALNSSDGYIYFDPAEPEGDEKAKNIRYSSVTLSMVADLSGASNSYWYTTLENADINATKCVMVRGVTPLSFNLGNLRYTLKSISKVDI